MSPLVTVGIPTYGRPELLSRALGCVARQSYVDLEVIVADNATPGDPNRAVVESYSDSIPGLRYVRHETNIGPVANFLEVLTSARGQYFMWLADDDEISDDYVATLSGLLEANPDAACATGHWMLMSSESDGRLMRTSAFPQRSALARAVRFVWRSDDAFFYGLHRTAILRQATFRGYWRPNASVIQNWAYVFLLDLVLLGRILLPSSTSVQFINHDYSAKGYETPDRSIRGLLARAIRRLNVHVLYWEKVRRRLGARALPIVVPVSLAALVRDAIGWLTGRAIRVARGGSFRGGHVAGPSQ